MSLVPAAPVVPVDLFPPERTALLELLDGLDAAAWGRPTVCPGWAVRDICAHLVADDLGRLSRDRDAYVADRWSGDEPLVAFIDRQNASWVAGARRLSPRVLVELLRWSASETDVYFRSLDPFAMGAPVSWAGPDPAPVWLDLARELTERWHHQQQIRDAVGAPPYDDAEVFRAVLETFAFSLPVALGDVRARDGARAELLVEGRGGGEWTVVREGGGWRLFAGRGRASPEARVTMAADVAWRMYTRALPAPAIRARARVEGDAGMAQALLGAFALVS